jgi:hypothetical protein
MQVDGRLYSGLRYGDVLIHNLTANIRQFGSIVTALYISFFEGQMFSRWIVANITSARGTLHCRKTHSLRGSTRDRLTICQPVLQLAV